MELGIYSFADLLPDPVTGEVMSAENRMHELLEEIQLADEVGLDVYGLGEHHRYEYISSVPSVILAAAAARTNNIRLTSAVTVLSSDDPVRVFQQFATLDLVSNGRAEIMAGRGSFIESFPLFGYDLDDYDDLFEEKLEELLEIRKNEILVWEGSRHTNAVDGRGVYPRPAQNPLPVWIAVGGTPQSVIRAAHNGLPLALAIIGGQPKRFASLGQLFRETAATYGHNDLPMSINAHGFIAETSQEAFDIAYPHHEVVMNRIGAERGWPPLTKEHFAREAEPEGALLLGSPQQVIDKILYQHSIFQHERFMLQMTVGTMPHDKVMKAIELYGTVVAPAVRSALSSS